MTIFFILYMACITRPAFSRSGSATHLQQGCGRDLPVDAELVGQPAAGLLLAAVGDQRVPVVIGLRLVLGLDEEREGLVVGHMRVGVERDDRQAGQLETDDGEFGIGKLRALTGPSSP